MAAKTFLFLSIVILLPAKTNLFSREILLVKIDAHLFIVYLEKLKRLIWGGAKENLHNFSFYDINVYKETMDLFIVNLN